MADCKILHCDCKSETQDEIYGKGRRLFNPIGKGSSQGDDYKCTVCGKSTKGTISKKK